MKYIVIMALLGLAICFGTVVYYREEAKALPTYLCLCEDQLTPPDTWHFNCYWGGYENCSKTNGDCRTQYSPCYINYALKFYKLEGGSCWNCILMATCPCTGWHLMDPSYTFAGHNAQAICYDQDAPAWNFGPRHSYTIHESESLGCDEWNEDWDIHCCCQKCGQQGWGP